MFGHAARVVRRSCFILANSLGREQDRFFYWIPVFYGSGIAIYFALPDEPSIWPTAIGAMTAMALAIAIRETLPGIVAGGIAASICLGLFGAKAASDAARAPVLARDLRHAQIVGWVELIEPRSGGGERLTIRVQSIGQLLPEATPQRVRVRVPLGGAALAPGDAISLAANLLPPAGPALPGAYDFARGAWFMGLGAVGSARSAPERVEIGDPIPLPLRLWVPIERVRQSISRRVTTALPGETGAIAAALITGERGGITEATNQAYRDSGIFHILSISGLHMTIFAGAIYFASRFVLSLWPYLALRYDIKDWAAIAGLTGTFGYLVISGGSPPAVRSAVMLSVMFLAILMDRPALALRNVALAALIILVGSPASLIDVGFQMSFAAVVALVAGVEAWRSWRLRGQADIAGNSGGTAGTALTFLGTITLTTLIATASVAPFAAYYFHKSTQYGVLSNLVAVPICNLVVMPAALASLMSIPFGVEWWPLAIMGFGIDVMTWIAYRVAALPGAVALVPAISATAFGAMIAGGLWLCLWGQRWRLLGLLPIAAGLALSPIQEKPDVLVGAGGALVGVRGPDGRLALLGSERSAFEAGRWLEHDADPRSGASVGTGTVIFCDAMGCRARSKGGLIAIARHPAALIDDCRRATLIVWLGHGDPSCRTRSTPGALPLLISRSNVRRDGTHAISIAGGSPGPVAATASAGISVDIRVRTVAQWRGRRPWVQSLDRSYADGF